MHNISKRKILSQDKCLYHLALCRHPVVLLISALLINFSSINPFNNHLFLVETIMFSCFPVSVRPYVEMNTTICGKSADEAPLQSTRYRTCLLVEDKHKVLIHKSQCTKSCAMFINQLFRKLLETCACDCRFSPVEDLVVSYISESQKYLESDTKS